MNDAQETVSRPKKLNSVETILYEIDMLDCCYSRLRGRQYVDEKEYYLYVEGFLLHYRNLSEFCGNHGDLKAGQPDRWSTRDLSRDEVRSIQDSGPLRQYSNAISRYLAHCNKIRAEQDRQWKYVQMYAQIEPLLRNFRNLFPARARPMRAIHGLSAESASTATMSILSPIIPDSGVIAPRPQKENDRK